MSTKPVAERWYGRLGTYKGSTGVVQIDSGLDRYERRGPLRLPEHVLRLADAEYQRQYGGTQDYERMQERAGLSVLEVVALLADYLDRLGATPSTPRNANP